MQSDRVFTANGLEHREGAATGIHVIFADRLKPIRSFGAIENVVVVLDAQSGAKAQIGPEAFRICVSSSHQGPDYFSAGCGVKRPPSI